MGHHGFHHDQTLKDSHVLELESNLLTLVTVASVLPLVLGRALYAGLGFADGVTHPHPYGRRRPRSLCRSGPPSFGLPTTPIDFVQPHTRPSQTRRDCFADAARVCLSCPRVARPRVAIDERRLCQPSSRSRRRAVGYCHFVTTAAAVCGTCMFAPLTRSLPPWSGCTPRLQAPSSRRFAFSVLVSATETAQKRCVLPSVGRVLSPLSDREDRAGSGENTADWDGWTRGSVWASMQDPPPRETLVSAFPGIDQLVTDLRWSGTGCGWSSLGSWRGFLGLDDDH